VATGETVAPPTLSVNPADFRPAARPVPPLVPAHGAGLAPGGEVPTPATLTREMAPPRKSYGHAQLDYQDAHGKRSFREMLASGLHGLALGAQGGGGLGGMLGGFGAGMLGQAIDPRAFARMRYEMGPGARRLAEDQREQTRREAEIKQRQMETAIAENEAQATYHQAQTQRAMRPEYNSAAWGTYDKATGQPGYTVPPRLSDPRQRVLNVPGLGLVDLDSRQVIPGLEAPGRVERPPQPVSERTVGYRNADGSFTPNPYYAPTPRATSPAEARRQAADELMAEEGTVEEIAAASLEGRKDALFKQLPPRVQEILSGNAVDAAQSEVNAAYALWERKQKDELKRIVSETRAVRQRGVGQRVGGARPVSPSSPTRPAPGQATRKLSDIVKRYGL
jgi:hypothetical protein